MSSDYWTNENDFENDLYDISDICDSTLPKTAPPQSQYMKKLLGGRSIFDDPYEEDVKDAECVPVRGYPVNKNGRLRLGGVPSFINSENRALIREVSGFGYSNDLIEHTLKDSSETDKESPYKMPNLAFRAISKSSSQQSFKADSDRDHSKLKLDLPKQRSTPSTPYTPFPQQFANVERTNLDGFNRKEFPDLR